MNDAGEMQFLAVVLFVGCFSAEMFFLTSWQCDFTGKLGFEDYKKLWTDLTVCKVSAEYF